MILGNVILGEGVLGDGDRSPGGPTEPPVTSSGGVCSLIHGAHVRISSGRTDAVVDFNAVNPADGEFLTGLSGFSVTRKRGSGAAVAMDTPTVTEVDATLMPGTYSLLCDEDMVISNGLDVESMVYRITHASIDPITLRVEIARPKITAGETLAVNDSGVITLPAITDDWLTPEGIADDVLPANFNQLSIELTTGKLELTDDNLIDIAAELGFNAEGFNALAITSILSRLPAALSPDGNMMSDIKEINTSADTLNRFAQAVDGNTMCVVGAGSTLTAIVTSSCDPAGVVGNPDQFAGKAGTFPKDTITPELRGKSFRITGSTGAVNPILTVTGLTIVPADGDKFNIL